MRFCSSTRRASYVKLEWARATLWPILMTTMTTIFALLALAVGIGEGADAQAPWPTP